MLVITRKLDQSIIINGNVEVHRREVFEAIAEANRAAAAQAPAEAQALAAQAAALLRARAPKVLPPK